jgi:integrase
VTVANTRTVVTGRVVSGPPKTTSAGRTIALDSVTATTLRAWRRQQSAERLVMGADWPNTDIVFTWQDGRSLYPQGVTKWFRAIAAEVNLPQIGVHGLRHTAATWMISSGVSPKLVAERLGHSNVSTTLSLYSHVLPGHDRAAAEALAAAFDLQSVTNP